MADLMRISGVGEEYSELLEAAGVDTVKELALRRADNLAAKMKEVNEAKKLTRALPAASQVQKWIDQAKTLDAARSEEHTSELQSLMRISYAVFCLKKKKDS